uniref:CRAL-TRIO domain-containing protein n=1 Tax=Hyaloperonospora arabidopsidis (strain Emoy2) TaxID=559515 RepID=M4BAR9_HYAAE
MATVKGTVAPPSSSALFSSASLRPRRHSVKTDTESSKSGSSFRRSSSTNKDSASNNVINTRPTSVSAPDTHDLNTNQSSVSTDVAPPLDTVSKRSPPRVAVRYGDTIRLFARSKYVTTEAEGGYVGTFAGNKRSLTSKSVQKQDERVCLPPIAPCGTKHFRSSTFVILSYSGLGAGTPVSYGDVVLLVDQDGLVWNNKLGVGPSLKNGCFGPKEANTPGEMHLSFYQLQAADADEGDGSSSSSDDEDSFVFFSNLAKTTKTMAETTFGKLSQVETHLATAALETIGKVVYYGDRNLVIDVVNSNRMRSKFNRVITHFSKQQESAPVRGGFLRCDGRGKTVLFEMHGHELPAIKSIDLRDVQTSAVGRRAPDEADHDRASSRVLVSTTTAIEVGTPVLLQDLRRSMSLELLFSDGGRVGMSCQRFLKHEGSAFYRLVLGGKRPMRILVRTTRAVQRKKIDLCGTLRGTYRQMFKLSCGIVIAYSAAASVLTHIFDSAMVLPAAYMCGLAGATVLLVKVVYLVKMAMARQTTLADTEEDQQSRGFLGSWDFTVVALEASESERFENTASMTQLSQLVKSVPTAFLLAENGDTAKALKRYENTLTWRKDVMADSILTMPQTHYDAIKASYTQFLHKHDKLGHPLYFEKIGSINIPQLKRVGVTPDALFKHYLFAMEFMLKYAAHEICPCDACAPSETQKICIVLDARGIGMRDMGGEVFEFIRRCTSAMQCHYPQRSFKIFIVNVPSWFGMAWKGVKPLLNEATRAKTNILTESETAAALLEFIDAENLPVEYGGTCSCSGGCETHSSYQLLQRALVESVLECKPFESEELLRAISLERSGESRSSEEGYASADDTALLLSPPPASGPVKRSALATSTIDPLSRCGSSGAESSCMLDGVDDEGFRRSIPANYFREEVLKAGYLLKRSLRHKQFNPIWHRQLFVLHPQYLRFAKALDSEIYQIVSLSHDTIVQKTTKQNKSFEIITPRMAVNGHSLLLCTPTSDVLNSWVQAISGAIDQLKNKTSVATRSPEWSPVVSPRAKQEASPDTDNQPTPLNSAK